ncbi:MAG TPA: AMP-dependent synthetase/ligase [Pseudonocardia sp.]
MTHSTVVSAFRATVAAYPDRVAFRTLGDETRWTWGELSSKASALARGLHELGLRPGERIGLMLGNRPEFNLCDVAAMLLGATPFSVYTSYAPEQIDYVLSDSGARILITEQAFLGRVLAAMEPSRPWRLIVVDGQPPPGATTLAELAAAGVGSNFDLDRAAEAQRPDDPITLIYTSGTTGNPKGVRITHRNVLGADRSAEGRVSWPEEARVISWLPSAHIAERVAHHYLPMIHGVEVTCCPDPKQIGAYLAEVQPTWFFAVPRVWEKMMAGLRTALGALPDGGAGALAAIEAGVRAVRLTQAGQPVPAELTAELATAERELFAGLRRRLGFGSLLTANVGAAPTPPEVLEFFHAIGVPVAELWGMSESTGSGTSNPPDRIKIGTVGLPSDNVELKLAEDGEILVRSEVVMAGYHDRPEQTAATVVDGWLYTGDIGVLDEDGYLTIVDRKKELIINAMGKNMSPALIESRLKAASPLIGQACCIGDGRSYNTALIVLDPDEAPAWARRQGIPGVDADTGLAVLAGLEPVRAAIQEAVDAANDRLSRVEQVKKFAIVPGDWPPAGDELTPTMKLRRTPIARKYAGLIEAMYR